MRAPSRDSATRTVDLAVEGSSVACVRCGWLESAQQATCRQCGAPVSSRWIHLAFEAPEVELDVTIPTSVLTQTADELQQFLAQWSDTLASEGAPSQPQRDAFFAQTLRRALWASSVDERWSLIRALTTGITGVAVIRFGDCRVPSATMDPARFVQRPRRDLARAPRELLPDAVLWLDLDDDLRVRRDEARVLSSHPAVIIASRNPLADGLRSLHAILALIHPELVGTRRHFLQRFGPLMEGRTSRDDASMSLALAQSVLPSTPGFRAPMACWPGSKHLAIDGWTLRYER